MSDTNTHHRVYNLYLSCTWNHQGMERELIRMLQERGELAFRVISLEPRYLEPLQDERLLYEAIRSKIKHSDAVLLMCGVYSTYSRWISKELIAAKSDLQKPVLSIQPFNPDRTSFIVKQYSDSLIDFQGEAIGAAIKDLSGIASPITRRRG